MISDFLTLQQSVTIEHLQQRISLHADMQAYKELYTFYYNGLYRFSFSIVQNSAIAEEIVSDAFLKLWQVRKRLMEISHLKMYLYKLVKNFSFNYKLKQESTLATEITGMPIAAQIETGNREDLCISVETVTKLQEAIAQLSPQGQLLFQLVKEDGFSYREAAIILSISPFFARHYLVLAIRKVAEVLPSYRQTAIPNIKSFSAS